MVATPDRDCKRGHYLSYLLRIWQKNGPSTHWLASLESADSHQRIGFPNLEALFEYIRQNTTEQCGAADVLVGKEVERKG